MAGKAAVYEHVMRYGVQALSCSLLSGSPREPLRISAPWLRRCDMDHRVDKRCDAHLREFSSSVRHEPEDHTDQSSGPGLDARRDVAALATRPPNGENPRTPGVEIFQGSAGPVIKTCARQPGSVLTAGDITRSDVLFPDDAP